MSEELPGTSPEDFDAIPPDTPPDSSQAEAERELKASDDDPVVGEPRGSLPVWALIAGGVVVLALVIAAGLALSGRLTPGEVRCLPASETVPAGEDRRLVVVTEIGNVRGVDFSKALREDLSGRPGLRVAQVCESATSDEAARALVAPLGASGVVWGEDGPEGVTVHVAWTQTPGSGSEGQRSGVPPIVPDAYVFVLGEDAEADLPLVGGFVRGYVAALNFDEARAVSELEAALASQPGGQAGSEQARHDANAATGRFALGTLHLIFTDDLQASVAAFDWAIRLDATNAAAHYNRGAAHLALGDPEAVADFAQVISLEASNATAYNGRGAAYLLSGDVEAALADLNQAISLDGTLAPAFANQGALHAGQGEMQAAIEDYTEALALDPNLTGAYAGRGEAFLTIGDAEAAIDDFGAVLARDPQYEGAHALRGDAYVALADYHAAIADFTQALVGAPDDPSLFFQRGKASFETADFLSAISDFTKVLAAEPENAEAVFLRANAYYGRRNYAAADADFTQALALTPDNAEAYFTRGVLRGDHLGAYEEAVRDFDAAIENGYDGADVYLARADALFYGQGRAGAALADYEAALRQNGASVRARRGYALALYDAGRFEDSAAAWQDALDADAFAGEHHAGLALALDALDEREAAVDAYLQALALDDRLANVDALRDEFGWSETARTAAGELLVEVQAALVAAEEAAAGDAGEDEESPGS